MNLDIRTLSFLIGISFTSQSIALFILYLRNKNYHGLIQWAVGSTLIALGFILFLFRHINFFESISIVFSNAFHISGIIWIYVGTNRFLGKKENKLLIHSFFFIFLLIIVYLTYLNNQLTIRTIFYSAAMAVASLSIGILIYRNKLRSIQTSALFVSITFFVLGLLFIVRTILLLTITPMNAFFTATTLQILTFVCAFAAGLLWTFGMIIMVNQRLNSELLETKKHFELIFNCSPDLAIITQLPDETIIEINEGFALNTGYTKEELIGKSTKELETWSNNSYRQLLVSELQQNGICRNLEMIFKRKDNSQFPGLLSASIVQIQDMPHIITIIRDISERKKMELDLIEAKERAEESDRLKSSFLANMSHEIRTPMNSIMGFASLLPSETDSQRTSNYANIIVHSSEQLVHIIDDIVLYSRLQTKLLSYTPRQFDINELLSDVHQSFNLPEFKNGIELLLENYSNESILIHTDYDKLRQVITNLVSNAFKYTSKGSITIGCNQENGTINFFVRDTGMGIPIADRNKVFERFYRGSNVNKSNIGGTGLGLSIVEELIHLLGGKIWVESEVQKGSTFNFIIPVKFESN